MSGLAYLQGLGIGAGLIIAIGAQNAFVLTQSIKGQHAGLIALVCMFCDGLLIMLGTLGMGSLVASNPQWIVLATWGGALFLFIYGLQSFYSLFRRSAMLEAGPGALMTARRAILITLGLTLLNPHVYLDTVVLLGSISGLYAGAERLEFAVGAVTASVLWFSLLALLGKPLRKLFSTVRAWKVLDLLIGLTMWGVGGSLLMFR
ncbi:LysE/ArgO family amino acid transporter [Sedimenticola selenatireducens]|uniref:Amino acid transporter n=1 Tax=Sedimenticola selenatireducens TaxID=191960 RepID=A0A557SMN7_9GAMM|nr:LysE/ArgO family amino acid transporter [Sedimenticola selenatireducens]TVO78679.1 amino acid transporter [Sedimenticola selenatireducens]TVT62041.1 MAG: amino acid transporter [Sedimenticola selenatireducens]